MILKWIQSLVSGNGKTLPEVSASSAGSHPAPFLDVVQEAFREVAANREKDLHHLERMGQPLFQRKKKKDFLKRKVRKALFNGAFAGEIEGEITDEITERILDVVEADPRYEKLFKE